MLKYFILLLNISFILPQFLFSQNGWSVLTNPLKNVHDIKFINSLTGYACGDSGKVIKTTNSGNSWEVVQYDVNYRSFTMTAIDFLDLNNGVAAGYESSTGLGQIILLRTTNAGGGWQVLFLGATYNIAVRQNVKILSKDTIIYCRFGHIEGSSSGEGTLQYTHNGGNNWKTVFSIGGGFTSLNFIDGKTGWVNEYHPYHGGIAYNKIYKTINSGVNWFVQQSDSTLSALELSVHFVNQDIGYAVGVVNNNNTKFLKTTNGGNTWENSIVNFGAPVRKIYFTNQNTGWIIGLSNLLRTTNGGNNWNTMPNGFFNPISNISFLNEYTGWMCGSSIVHPNSIVKTTTGGIMNTEPHNQILNEYKLSQNYPNPFNPTTKINFNLPERNYVKLIIYDVMGRQMKVLVDEELNEGSHEKIWNAEHFPSGLYFYKLSVGSFSEFKKMVLLK
jgi:photosystem II stability/assembly factor-like uncharacterized protein